ncbi:hypothetical protein ACC696_37850, partial [Rhizobium ruizarguesonis]
IFDDIVWIIGVADAVGAAQQHLQQKVTAWAPNPSEAIARMDRALSEFRIRGVATNLTFLEAIIGHTKFRDNRYTTRFIDTTPELFQQVKRQD